MSEVHFKPRIKCDVCGRLGDARYSGDFNPCGSVKLTSGMAAYNGDVGGGTNEYRDLCAGCLRRVEEALRPPKGRLRIFQELEFERVRQDRKWGGPEHDDEHSPEDWVRYIADHNQRALAAERDGDSDGYRYQLLRIAALAVAALESNDRLLEAEGLTPKRLEGSQR